MSVIFEILFILLSPFEEVDNFSNMFFCDIDCNITVFGILFLVSFLRVTAVRLSFITACKMGHVLRSLPLFYFCLVHLFILTIKNVFCSNSCIFLKIFDKFFESVYITRLEYLLIYSSRSRVFYFYTFN